MLFHKNSIKYDLPLKLPDLKIAKNQIEKKKKNSIKFLVIMLDENVNWQGHICAAKNKILGFSTVQSIYKMNRFSFVFCFFFAYINSYLNYANIAWASTYQTKLKAIHLLKNMLYLLYLIKRT